MEVSVFLPFYFFHALILLGHIFERLTTYMYPKQNKLPKPQKTPQNKSQQQQQNPMTLILLCSRNSAREFWENMKSGLVLQSKFYLRVKTETLREACDHSFCLLISGSKACIEDFTSLVSLSDQTFLFNSFLSEFVICL